MKQFLKAIFVLILFLLFLSPAQVMGVEGTPSAVKKYAINFPIAQLGNCADLNSCKTYCDQEVNRQACISFAKAKGFYKENQEQVKAVEYAKTELGCSDPETCKNFCQQTDNAEKCRSFAEKHGLKKTQGPDNKQQEIVNKAKTVLGCDSQEACKNICEKPENRDKCANFARDAGLDKGNEKSRVGPGGCGTEEACKNYCTDAAHQEECSKFKTERRGDDKPRINAGEKGPGGCSSEEECRKYCGEHPDECKKDLNNIQKNINETKNDNISPEKPRKREMEKTGPNNKIDFQETRKEGGPQDTNRIPMPPPENKNDFRPQNMEPPLKP